jgi:hypothetical protein
VDSVLKEVCRQAADDVSTVGVLLIGSHATGTAGAQSDYDLVWILTDGELAARTGRGQPRQVKDGRVDTMYTSVGRLGENAAAPDWFTGALLSSRVVLDKTGEIRGLLERTRRVAGARAREDVPSSYDSYLNGYVRSLKAWRRSDELGGRLHAGESMSYLVRTLCGLAGRWPPYHDELERTLPEIEAELGLDVLGDVRSIVSTGDPLVQQKLETRVERFMTERGVLHEWEGALDELRAWRF